MRYTEFTDVMTSSRMGRYLTACGGNSQKAMTLYRKNLKLSQILFSVISYFEIALRNAIDKHYKNTMGNYWLQNAAAAGGVFDNGHCYHTRASINEAIRKLSHTYTPNKLVAELGFGFWRFMFASQQFRACGRTLFQILPGRPRSTPQIQYNNTYIFNQLAIINNLRNRIAHHEPICFTPGQPVKDTSYARRHYSLILQLFQWMGINDASLLYGLDHILLICNQIDDL
jgi:hypothetical protein